MQLTRLCLKNFRCFADQTLDLQNQIVLIEGANGSGKTSILEAIHYVCYLRSFRTHSPSELVHLGDATFFIKAHFNTAELHGIEKHELQVGFSGKKRLVKLNQKSVASYKELLDFYRVVTLTEDDMDFVQGGPHIRRAFIDQALMLYKPEYMQLLKRLRQIVDQRTRVLSFPSSDYESWLLWTQQLWALSHTIQQTRIDALAGIEQETNRLLQAYINPQMHISFNYLAKRDNKQESFEAFLQENPTLYADEQRVRYCLFGAHMDDILITFNEKKSRIYASRGQQKLIIALVKMAQMAELIRQKGKAVFLFDDFMADFDEEFLQKLLQIAVSLDTQLIFTSPVKGGILPAMLQSFGAQTISLTY